MKARFPLALVLSFAGGVLLMAALGGATGAFSRGPSDLDLADAQARGRADAAAEVDYGKQDEAAEQRRSGYERGRESALWLFLDRRPNPDSWFSGMIAGRAALLERAEEAYQQGRADGERTGYDEALGAHRLHWDDAGAEASAED